MVRGVGSTSLLALDAPRRAGTFDSVSWIAASLGAVVLVLVGLFAGDSDIGNAEGLMTSFNVLIATASLGAAFVIYSHAAASRNRAYLALGSTYVAVGWSAIVVLLVTPGALISGEQLMGGATTAAWSMVFMHLILPVGIGITAAILWGDGRVYRRPGRRTHVAVSVLSSVAVLLAVGAVVVLAGDNLPVLLDADGQPTAAWSVTWAVVTGLAAASLAIVLLLGNFRYSIVAGWMTAVAALALGSAVMNIAAPEFYSVSWLLAAVFCLIAVLLVPLMMLIQLGRVERTARRVAEEDSLTGLTSRGGLLARLDHEVERATVLGREGAVLWVDLDGFKAVNDQFGHARGDDALRQIAARLRRAARPSDTVARLAGDEFGILVADLGEHTDATAIAKRALSAVHEPILFEDAAPLLTASIGIVHFPRDGDDADQLMHLADLAMYEAKHDGGDGIVTFNEPMATRASRVATARQRLARAMREQSFELHYQPMTDLSNGRHFASEALLRWKRDGQIISAASFVPMAEANGQIRQLGRIVLDILAEDLRSAPVLPADFKVAVNLSVPELADPAVSEMLTSGELAAFIERITIEVTEGVMLADHVGAIEHLRLLRHAGATIALDDFGAGFANVEALAGLRPDLIKVDRAFIHRAGKGDTSGVAFLQAARAIGEAIGADVLAEGIETAHELEIVTEMGITLGQGHFLGNATHTLLA
ncbi:MAG: putative bifunctional diguanylate cyclase/phosphodiesterase [Microthrixaceae bacterium]